MMPATPVYHRAVHAAHYMGATLSSPRRGHDLETWTVLDAEHGRTRPSFVPGDATLDYGNLDDQGRQLWVWRRIAPLSAGTCDRCPRR